MVRRAVLWLLYLSSVPMAAHWLRRIVGRTLGWPGQLKLNLRFIYSEFLMICSFF